MKATAEKLEKIDFSKCRPRDWGGRATIVKRSGTDVHIELAGWNGWIARKPVGYEWRIATNGSTRAELDALYSMCEQVDTFIASEIASAELAKKRERTKPEPGEGFEYCEKENAAHACIWCLGNPDGFWGPWKPVSHFEFGNETRDYLFRRPKQAAPKLPTVKAPDGWSWERGGECASNTTWLFRDHGDFRVGWTVPRDRETRDVMAACVAAFDEANGSRFVQIEDFVRSTTTYRPAYGPFSAWVHNVRFGNGTELNIGDDTRFKCGSRVRVTIEELPETSKPA